MTGKKSQAQIRRLQQRAAARGEEYVAPPPPPVDEERDEASSTKKETGKESKEEKWLEIAKRLKTELTQIEESSDLPSKSRRSAKRKVEAIAAEDAGIAVSELMEWYEKEMKRKMKAKSTPRNDTETSTKRQAVAIQLKKELDDIEKMEDLKAKDRRSARRKAEAIASEATGMPADELLSWYETFLKSQPVSKEVKKRNHDPYIAFIGQLSYETTLDELFNHIQDQLKNEMKVKRKDVKIRILTDDKTKKSRGMAFVEVDNPELLYGLLKLHQTFLNGRRINVERSAGGKKSSEVRKVKLAQYRKEQDQYFSEVVDKILKEYKDTGELRDDELDEGVISLCKRHAGPVVRAALVEYIEKGGRDMDNPSAYFTFLVTKFATEGIREDKEETNKVSSQSKRKSKGGESFIPKKKFKQSSEFAQAGVDMSLSEKSTQGKSNLTRVFPSARRGRGRGYM